MIRHVVMFRWTPEATEEQKQRVAASRGSTVAAKNRAVPTLPA